MLIIWTIWISLQQLAFDEANACFNNPVGVADPGVIPDELMTASTQLSFRQAIHGRLNGNRNGGGGWCTENCCESQEWLQVDLGQTTEICGVATQGNVLFGAYATSFKLSFSRDRSSWTFYKDTDGVSEKLFHRIGNSRTVDQHLLPVPVSARYIRFHPVDRYLYNCLRVEVYGTTTCCRSVQFTHDVRDKVLENHVIKSVQVPDKDRCEISCYQEPNCVSYNYGPAQSEWPVCELNDRNHEQVSSSNLVSRQGYIYRQTLNSCQSNPCWNNATCQAGFTYKGYRCICSSGYRGVHCSEIAAPTASVSTQLTTTGQSTQPPTTQPTTQGQSTVQLTQQSTTPPTSQGQSTQPPTTQPTTQDQSTPFPIMQPVTTPPGCLASWSSYGGSCYRLFTSAKTWFNAEAACLNNAALLVKIESVNENEFIKTEYLTATVDYWIGLSDSVNEGTWKWRDGTVLTGYTNWFPGEPTNGTDEDCIAIRMGQHGGNLYDAQWPDINCYNIPRSFICEM